MRFHCNALPAAIFIACIAGIPSAAASANPQGNCDKAEKQLLAGHEPKDWDRLHRLFKKFGACDDGAIGEAFSGDVAQLLSKQWTHLDRLSRLTTGDKKFEQFVLRHIDATLDENDLLAIFDHAKSHCPAGQQRICGLIRARAQESLDTLGNVSE